MDRTSSIVREQIKLMVGIMVKIHFSTGPRIHPSQALCPMQLLRLKVPSCALFFVGKSFLGCSRPFLFLFFCWRDIAMDFMLNLSMSIATRIFDHANNERSSLLIY